MKINADFTKRVIVHADQTKWQASPMKGVRRKMFDRIGDEVARATSLVRYDPNSHFSPHVHTGGEEFVVLEGTFQDEHRDYPVGSYVRNPPESKHTPSSESGCLMFVKLWQFDLTDRTHIHLNIHDTQSSNVVPLFQDVRENVRFEVWEENAVITIDTSGGAEVFVLEGTVSHDGDTLRLYSWLRLPIGANETLVPGVNGARVWIKTGHLRFVHAPSV